MIINDMLTGIGFALQYPFSFILDKLRFIWLTLPINIHITDSHQKNGLGKRMEAMQKGPTSEPALELQSRAVPSVEAHHRVNSPDTGRNLGGRRIKKHPLRKDKTSQYYKI